MSLVGAGEAYGLFVSGTSVEVTPFKGLDGRVIGAGGPGPITRRLQARFFDAVHGRLPEYREWLSPVRQVETV